MGSLVLITRLVSSFLLGYVVKVRVLILWQPTRVPRIIHIQVFSHFVFGQVKPVRLSSLEVSKVTFPSAFKGLINEDTNVDNLPFSRSLAAKNNEISERASPKELPLVQWVQDYANPPPRWFCTRLRVMTIVMVGENVEIMWMIMWMMMMKGLS